ncbi:PucR family transcriptional regulator [Cryptosporangium minutisporangium]|uniref:Transcriptional regulator n=1 Tax=Cryptosporangium minutisporangium TaxID=113569 RepID=A0ABP6T993_9ACTN
MSDEPLDKPDSWWREQLSKLYGLFVTSMIMLDGRELDDILHLATTSVPSLCGCEVDAVCVRDGIALTPWGDYPGQGPALEAALRALDNHSGPVTLTDGAWRWALALGRTDALVGYLVVRSTKEPSTDEFFLLKALGQQTGGALANAALHQRQREQTAQLRSLNQELSETVRRLERRTRVHEMLGAISASGTGEVGIALALHQLTGLSVAVEDRFGNLRAWAGPSEPQPYPKVSTARRDAMLRHASAQPHPSRWGDRMVSVARPRQEILGVLALVDPRHTIGRDDLFALEYATTVLALELSHQRRLAEVELRLRRNLVDDLITGVDEESAYARADAIGHDLRVRHHVVVIRWGGTQTEDAVAEAAAAAAAALDLRTLTSRRSGIVVMLVSSRPDATALHGALVAKLGEPGGALGLGGPCETPTEFPRSYSEAVRAAEIRAGSRTPSGATAFDQLGLYRILDTGQGREDVSSFVQEWLGRLLDYDRRKGTDLVRTLSQYLERGGNYDETASALLIHRSTLRYRLGRIREISGCDLNDVDDRLNLHVATRAWQVLHGPG